MKKLIKIHRIKHPTKNSVVTFASMVDNNKVQIGYSFSSLKDRFCKAEGRRWALDRMFVSPVIDDFTGHSSASIARVWEQIKKPSIWKRVLVKDVEKIGLTVVL